MSWSTKGVRPICTQQEAAGHAVDAKAAVNCSNARNNTARGAVDLTRVFTHDLAVPLLILQWRQARYHWV